MNVAEHLNGSWLVERPRFRRPLGVAAEVESALPGGRRQREDVVIDVILVRKVDRGALLDRQHMWLESLVVLGDSGMRRPGAGRAGHGAIQIDHDVVQLRGDRIAW